VEIQTTHFDQKFMLEFLLPERVIPLVHSLKNSMDSYSFELISKSEEHRQSSSFLGRMMLKLRFLLKLTAYVIVLQVVGAHLCMIKAVIDFYNKLKRETVDLIRSATIDGLKDDYRVNPILLRFTRLFGFLDLKFLST